MQPGEPMRFPFTLIALQAAAGCSTAAGTSGIGSDACKAEAEKAQSLLDSKASGWSNLICVTDGDCTLGRATPSCMRFECADIAVTKAGAAALAAAVQQANDTVCTSACVYPYPPCVPTNEKAACVMGSCTAQFNPIGQDGG